MFSRQLSVVFSFSVAKNSVNLSKNYYKILQVDTKCDQKILKNSYLKLVKALHPDVNPNGKEKFTQVQEAYEVLSDKELKIYYDKNNHCNNNSTQSGSQAKETHSAQSKTRETSSGHSYYSHRTYASQNPHDYFHNQNRSSNAQNQSKKQKQKQYENDQDDQQEKAQQKSTNFNRQQKQARSKASWQEFQRRRQYEEERQFRHQTPQQKIMRDKLKAMRGFTSSYNVIWGRHMIRPCDVMNNPFEAEKRKQEQLRNLMPQKVRNFYDKLMEKIQKIAKE